MGEVADRVVLVGVADIENPARGGAVLVGDDADDRIDPVVDEGEAAALQTPIDQLEPYPCTTPVALLYAVKTPVGDLSLSWDPACTTRYLRRTLDPWRVEIEIPFADSAVNELTIPFPSADLEFFAIE